MLYQIMPVLHKDYLYGLLFFIIFFFLHFNIISLLLPKYDLGTFYNTDQNTLR